MINPDNEMDYEDISPLYMQRLKNEVREALLKMFGSSSSRDLSQYIERWYESDDFRYENFHIYEIDSGGIDLDSTLADMDNRTLMKIAADIGVQTPGLIPCIPLFTNILSENNGRALNNFERAVKSAYDDPDQSVALASSTLEGLFKTILSQSENGETKGTNNKSLEKLTKSVVQVLVDEDSTDCPKEIVTIASQLRGLGSSIDALRSDKSTAHGKTDEDYVIDDPLWAELIVNTTATLGIFLWRLHMRKTNQNFIPELPYYDDDIAF